MSRWCSSERTKRRFLGSTKELMQGIDEGCCHPRACATRSRSLRLTLIQHDVEMLDTQGGDGRDIRGVAEARPVRHRDAVIAQRQQRPCERIPQEIVVHV